MFALNSVGEKVEWDNNRWTPLYDDSGPRIVKKIINNQVRSYHLENLVLNKTDFVSDY